MKDSEEMIKDIGIEDAREISLPRQRHGFTTKQKLIIKASMTGPKSRSIALKFSVAVSGVESAYLEGQDKDLIVVIGAGIDAASLVALLRKKIGFAELISMSLVEEPSHCNQISENPAIVMESSLDLDKATEANTCINSGPENGESSSTKNGESLFTSETTEWPLLMMSLLLEGMSAIFDQLTYALMGMVMAFAALLLSTIELIGKAQNERVTLDGKSLLPCFYRHSTHNTPSDKSFGSLIEYFGLIGALWQCFYSTMEYQYARQNKDNPVKMCLLPFIFVLCVVISKLIRSEPQESLAEALREGAKREVTDNIESTGEKVEGVGEKEIRVEQKEPSTTTVEKRVFSAGEEVNARADDFINRFKQQLKFQRLDSLLRHKEFAGKQKI